MAKNLDLFIRTSILLLVGCYTPPITNINEPAALTLDETKINNQQALITLEQLNVDMSSSIWRQYFAQRGAESIWGTLQQKQERLYFNSEGLTTPLLFRDKLEDEIVAGIVHYLVCYGANIKRLELTCDRLHNGNRALTSLPVGIVDLTSLKTLNIMNNYLEELPGGMNKLTSLKELNISINNFSILPLGVLNMVNLSILDLSMNNLIAIPSEIGQLTRLSKLDLADNKLQALPAEIGSLVNLKELNVSFNLLTRLPKEIGALTKLESLDLSDNSLIELPTEINGLLSLAYLDLSKNKLQKLPASSRSKLNMLLLNRKNLADNPWLTVQNLRPIDKQALKAQAYQLLPHSLLTLCMEFVEEYVKEHPQHQVVIDKTLPDELSQKERRARLKDKGLFIAGKDIIFFKRINARRIPFYLDYTLCTYQDVSSMAHDMEHKKLYQVIDTTL